MPKAGLLKTALAVFFASGYRWFCFRGEQYCHTTATFFETCRAGGRASGMGEASRPSQTMRPRYIGIRGLLRSIVFYNADCLDLVR